MRIFCGSLAAPRLLPLHEIPSDSQPAAVFAEEKAQVAPAKFIDGPHDADHEVGLCGDDVTLVRSDEIHDHVDVGFFNSGLEEDSAKGIGDFGELEGRDLHRPVNEFDVAALVGVRATDGAHEELRLELGEVHQVDADEVVGDFRMIEHVEVEAIDALMKEVEAAVFLVDRHAISIEEFFGFLAEKFSARLYFVSVKSWGYSKFLSLPFCKGEGREEEGSSDPLFQLSVHVDPLGATSTPKWR